MDTQSLEARLWAAVAPHDLLCHPYYQAWNMGQLTRADLRAYAAQYRHQVDALPAMLRRAIDGLGDAQSRDALQRNLDEEEGVVGAPHAQLWAQFAEGLGEARTEDALPETRETVAALRSLAASDDVTALAALWAYETQTARVAKTKREGLAQRYGVTEPKALQFFALHESLDVHHAAELLQAVARACGGDEAKLAKACEAASASAQAQWRFLDGAEARRAA